MFDGQSWIHLDNGEHVSLSTFQIPSILKASRQQPGPSSFPYQDPLHAFETLINRVENQPPLPHPDERYSPQDLRHPMYILALARLQEEIVHDDDANPLSPVPSLEEEPPVSDKTNGFLFDIDSDVSCTSSTLATLDALSPIDWNLLTSSFPAEEAKEQEGKTSNLQELEWEWSSPSLPFH